MPRTRRPYAAEFRHRLVELVRAGRNPAELSREFRCSAQAIRNWVGASGRSMPGSHAWAATLACRWPSVRS